LGDSTPGIRRVQTTLVDESRATPATPDRARRPCRVLPTEVRFPEHIDQALPLVVMAHGLDGNPSRMGPLLDAWAAAGYFVVAPRFPITVKGSNGRANVENNKRQAADIRFLIDEVIAQSGDPNSPLFGKVDTQYIGVSGMSLGGQTAYMLVTNTCCLDRRITAAVPLAAVHRDVPGHRWVANRVPMFLVHGDADKGYHNSVSTYPTLAPPKWLVTLHGQGHSSPFEVPEGPAAPLVKEVTTSFWNLSLKSDPAAAGAITQAVAQSDGAASVRADLGQGPIHQ
jgi:dienelactone hydrolase